jgi:hypothetical protein
MAIPYHEIRAIQLPKELEGDVYYSSTKGQYEAVPQLEVVTALYMQTVKRAMGFDKKEALLVELYQHLPFAYNDEKSRREAL